MITHAKSRLAPTPITGPTGQLVVGVVHGPFSVLHVAAARSRRMLMRTLALWATAQAREKLPTPESEQVERLVREGRHGAAVQRYFDLVGGRWDPERLVIERVDVAG